MVVREGIVVLESKIVLFIESSGFFSPSELMGSIEGGVVLLLLVDGIAVDVAATVTSKVEEAAVVLLEV